MGIFSDAQGHLTPQTLVESGRNWNLSGKLWLSSLQVSPDKPRCDLTRISVERGCLMDPKIFPKIPNPLIFKSVAL